MSEETKKVDQTKQEPKATELSEQELDNVAGGAATACPKCGHSPCTCRPVTVNNTKSNSY